MNWRRNNDDAIEYRDKRGVLLGAVWKRMDTYAAAVYSPYKLLGHFKKKEAMFSVEKVRGDGR